MKARITMIAAFAVATILFAVQPAGAAITIGSSLAGSADDAFGCASSCTVVQSTVFGRIAQAPRDGVIVRWRIKTDAPGGPFALQVARPAVGDARIGVGTSSAVMTAAGGISEFPTRIPVKQGDNIGLNFTSANTARFTPDGADAGATTIYFDTTLTNGQSNLATLVNTDTEFLVNADFEGDLDADGFGDDTQDLCVGIVGGINGCATAAPTITVTAKSRQRYRRMSVKVASDRSVELALTGKVSVKLGQRRQTLRIKRVRRINVTNPALELKFYFPGATRGKVKKLLLAKRKLVLSLDVKATDRFGGVTNTVRKIRLVR